ncbi:T9SS type A sorting domain-containing protein, partial [bacterium]|nr:T9SS type A sorting domain-containing protein [bacterium]
FVWDDDETPTQLDVSAAVPWRSGTPRVTVKIYSVNGQELVTLFSGDMGVGENVVSWSGTDSYGRSVSSGTYFCKLQMDDWSVTRRLVYIR